MRSLETSSTSLTWLSEWHSLPPRPIAKLENNLLPGLELLHHHDQVLVELARRASSVAGIGQGVEPGQEPSSARRLAFSEIVGRVADWICRIVLEVPPDRGFRPGFRGGAQIRHCCWASCWRWRG